MRRRASRSRRREARERRLLSEPWLLPMTSMKHSAGLIQRWWKRVVRPRFGLMQEDGSGRTCPPVSRRKSRGAKLIDRYIVSCSGGDGGGGGFAEFCTVRLQSWWRMQIALRRWSWHRFFFFHVAATQIQYFWRQSRKKRLALATMDESEDAARTIQRAWKLYSGKVLFRYLRDLVSFKLCGDPKTMLRTVIPSEAQYFDCAMAVHVRFRLGGETFPPRLYYKVYTHAPVADIGSFAPREYFRGDGSHRCRTQAGNKISSSETKSLSLRVGKKSFGAFQSGGKQEGWYERVENNCWRPVCDTWFESLTKDDPSSDSHGTSLRFHHKVERRKELRRKRLQIAKRRWLRSMHKESLAIESSSGKFETLSADTSLFQPHEGDDGVHWEDRAELLLRWSSNLDFDSYVAVWDAFGTSASS